MTLSDQFQDKGIRFFEPDEFACKCGRCDANRIDVNYVVAIDQFREWLGFPFIVTSGYRCPFHPIEARKTAPGPHSTGRAGDYAISGLSAHTLLYALGEFKRSTGYTFTGVGLDQKGDISQRFIHLDRCESKPNRPRPHLWTY